jgi:hypothetical protein
MLWTETHSHVALKADPNEAFEIFLVSAVSSVIYFSLFQESDFRDLSCPASAQSLESSSIIDRLCALQISQSSWWEHSVRRNAFILSTSTLVSG